MNSWQNRSVPFKYQLSDWSIFNVALPLQVRSAGVMDTALSQAMLIPPTNELAEGNQGFLVRALPVTEELPVISRSGDYLCYIPLQYQHCYIDFSLSFEDYKNKFTSKTRSTINRKVRKYKEYSGGAISWKTYTLPVEMREFFRLARIVSKRTYQEKLLDAGIPESEDFISQAELLAAAQCIRAYILFDGEKPVSYLYCPAKDGILIYAYLGYDPDYMKMSVGTVLQWLALEQLFKESSFRCFDFTEGQSDHKQLFATHQQRCANVFLIKNSVINKIIIYSHLAMNYLSGRLGTIMDSLGLKIKIKRFLRFSR